MLSTVGSAACDLAENVGLRVFPCNRDKTPCIADWPNAASRDLDTVEAMFTGRGDSVAVLTGDPVVVDIDDMPAFDRWSSETGIIMPPTWTAETGRGRHLYFRAPEGREIRNGKLPWGDVKGHGGYVIAPPSPHPSGATYRWAHTLDPDNVDLAPFPLALLEYVGNGNKPTTAPPLPEVIADGNRNNVLTSLAGSMRRRGASETAILAALHSENRDRCSPPLPDREVERIAASVGRYEPATEPAETATAAGPLVDLWQPLDPDTLTTPPPTRHWLFRRPDGEGLLPRGRAGILAGAGGCGKTLVLIAAAVSVATGRKWLNHFDVAGNGGKVSILLAEEDEDEWKRRVWRVARALNLTEAERRLCVERIVAVPLAGHQVQITEMADGRLIETGNLAIIRRQLAADPAGWALVVLDPLSRFAGGDVEGSNEAATRFMQAVESLCRAPGAPTVLVSAHSSKLVRRQGGADVRGVTGLTDAARWVATLAADGDNIEFSQFKSNYSLPMDPLPLRWSDDGILTVLSTADRLVAEQRKESAKQEQMAGYVDRLVAVVRKAGEFRGSRTDLVNAAGIRKSAGLAAVAMAMSDGLIEHTGPARQRVFKVSGTGTGSCGAS